MGRFNLFFWVEMVWQPLPPSSHNDFSLKSSNLFLDENPTELDPWPHRRFFRHPPARPVKETSGPKHRVEEPNLLSPAILTLLQGDPITLRKRLSQVDHQAAQHVGQHVPGAGGTAALAGITSLSLFMIEMPFFSFNKTGDLLLHPKNFMGPERRCVLPWKLTCPLKINGWKVYFLLK